MKHHRLAFSRPIAVADLPAQGIDIRVEANPAERAAIAHEFNLVEVEKLSGVYHVSATASGARVRGEAVARIRQICVVSLDAFNMELHEPVDLAFAAERGDPGVVPGKEITISTEDPDPPEPLLRGMVDLGAVTLEFLALGLDPYPRKPDVEFSHLPAEDASGPSPFRALAVFARKTKAKE